MVAAHCTWPGPKQFGNLPHILCRRDARVSRINRAAVHLSQRFQRGVRENDVAGCNPNAPRSAIRPSTVTSCGGGDMFSCVVMAETRSRRYLAKEWCRPFDD